MSNESEITIPISGQEIKGTTSIIYDGVTMTFTIDGFQFDAVLKREDANTLIARSKKMDLTSIKAKD